jgi:hypothetical protein
VAAKFKADSRRLLTLEHGPLKIGREHTSSTSQTIANIDFNDLEGWKDV